MGDGYGYTIDCNPLETRTILESYINIIKNVTGDDFRYLEDCKPQICSAIWSTGNSDISGVGMIAGYLINTVLGFSLAMTFAVAQHLSKGNPCRTSSLLGNLFRTYFNCAIYFAVSIQIANVVIFAKKDMGITASGFGGLTEQMTWCISLLTMLPLLFPVFIQGVFRDRNDLRYFLFCICWALFFYTFQSHMASSFGNTSQIGDKGPRKTDGSGPIITTVRWSQISHMCFAGVEVLSDQAWLATQAFGITASLFICLLTLIRAGWIILMRRLPEMAMVFRKRFLHERGMKRICPLILLATVLILTLPQIWVLFQIRLLQRGLAHELDIQFDDERWTFGQIVAVSFFAPVLAELLHDLARRIMTPEEEPSMALC
ncbi:MAG: hypothetical protein M1833_003803 [Piccolia ochrophora]|nr:MAG: hypothetical protein M1833_003803 [Piccolia ochrophora]